MDETLVDVPVGELALEGVTPSAVSTDTTVPSGNELIDATQSVIIDAAANVSQVFDKTDAPANETVFHEPFYMEVEFWVGVAFVLAVLTLLRPLSRIIKNALTNRINRVVSEINEAMKLRDDAQILLADYERKVSHVDEEVAAITGQIECNLQNLKKYETSKMKDQMKNKEKNLRRSLAQETEHVRSEINALTGKRAVYLAHKAICKYLREADQKRLIDSAIDELDKFIA